MNFADEKARLEAILPIRNCINNEFVDANSSKTIPDIDPSTNIIITTIPDSDAIDLESSVEAAKAALPIWSSLSNTDRSNFLLIIADKIEENIDTFAYFESLDNGKPISLAKSVDIPRAIANFRFFATAILHYSTDAHEMVDAINYTIRKPLGVVGCISPWNLPLYLFTWKIAPALASGNCVVAKPSEVTPLTAYLLSHICVEVGLPKGVLNIVHGLGAKVGDAITTHPDIKAISFTGGTLTGSKIAAKTAPLFKKLSLEMGGKNPNIIFADCDFEGMIGTTVRSSFSNQGEICLCGSRIFVERPLYDKFKDEFVKRVERLLVGDPLDDNSNLGAIVSEAHFKKIMGYIDLARSEGGLILTGGEKVSLQGRCEQGWFITPTVIENLPFSCRTNQEEIFGPVVTIMPFDTEEEVLNYANSTKYGLSATLWTENVSRVNRITRGLDAGIVWVNCWMKRDLRTPFGGMKDSGIGREGGRYALDFFTETKNVCIKYS